jgi:hypothetical protein
MRKIQLLLATAAVCGFPLVASAHTGGALDAEGCHADHRKGTYHCHRGDAAGYTFPDRPAMQEAVRTGKFPEKSVDAEGFFEKLWPWGSKHQQQQATPPAATGSSDAPASAPAPAAGAAAPATGSAPGGSPVVDAPPAASPAAPAAPGASPAPAGSQNEYERRLKVLQGLYEMGLITREEYEAKRQEVLGQL